MLNFICNWEGCADRRQCWSGTPAGIEEALKRHIDVNDVALRSENKIEGYLRKIWSCIFFQGSDFNIISTMKGVREINSRRLSSGNPCISLLEYDSHNVSDTYIYQDLTVDYVLRFAAEHPELADHTPIPKYVSKRTLAKRWNMTVGFMERCRGIFTMSHWLANDLIENTRISQDKVHWVGGGCNIDTEKIDVTGKTGNKYLFIGRDWKRKNGSLVIEAFNIVKSEYNNVELYIAGPSKCPEEARNVPGVRYLGDMDYDQLIRYYNLCDYFVMPSQFEAYGIVFGEALIYGLPCIGKREFAMPEFICDGDNGYLIDDNDPIELACKMKMLLQNREMKRKVISQSGYYQSMYSWDAVANRMIEVFSSDGYDL